MKGVENEVNPSPPTVSDSWKGTLVASKRQQHAVDNRFASGPGPEVRTIHVDLLLGSV